MTSNNMVSIKNLFENKTKPIWLSSSIPRSTFSGDGVEYTCPKTYIPAVGFEYCEVPGMDFVLDIAPCLFPVTHSSQLPPSTKNHRVMWEQPQPLARVGWALWFCDWIWTIAEPSLAVQFPPCPHLPSESTAFIRHRHRTPWLNLQGSHQDFLAPGDSSADHHCKGVVSLYRWCHRQKLNVLGAESACKAEVSQKLSQSCQRQVLILR